MKFFDKEVVLFITFVAIGLGLVVTTPGESLKKLRNQIGRFTRPREFDQAPMLSKNWQYLDGM